MPWPGTTHIREFVEGDIGESRVVLDFALVSSLDDVARRMLLELARRLTLEGRGVYFVDPELTIPDPDRGDGILVPVIADAKHVLRGGPGGQPGTAAAP
ncbi:hypothetical protein LOC59_05450 [Arthrobacter sp. zg-Y916]|uniref:hypothetical protein n=1 Tax=Arthrobacter sp. zg-Y916 TaxID=2894190 RepID=UPI001E584FCC|nr:hypothetical protein [Arthrobacter sp. zg-Y916]MCC9193095.1 hypothetical protein [Arthrobacter sp. zg-Y916]